ncbi:potassium channel family protein [Palleronia caenipelagi]|uniref:Potassium channel family protein n=1 Tax=Palleronia caenipelagi TaxID=2489174 RepID=A0A547Q9L4_9RHOB|nr:potassium channel family protein [Palleronia caenipelagi]TRD23088.1 potassium channel family protein [Palleronia caenipelagi]
MKSEIRQLYLGSSRRSRIFQFATLIFDLATVAYFLFTATKRLDERLIAIDVAIGAVILADFVVRLWVARNKKRFLFSWMALADIVVIASMFAPLITGTNLGFLRILRVLRIVRSFQMVWELDRLAGEFRLNSQVSVAAANLIIFIFVVTSVVWVWERDHGSIGMSYLDALYFTIATLTTTGYGDITLSDQFGRVINIVIMVFGVGFFLNLVQALYRPNKIEAPCEECGLRLHDNDASHCKHCGSIVYIETEGDT